jgi:hypothetical protein
VTPEQAAWVRANVWTPIMRKAHRDSPDSRCSCQYGPSMWCVRGDCGQCQRGEPLRHCATYIVSRSGYHPATFLVPYRHKTPTATGGVYAREAMVWLDRRCRYACPCPRGCHGAAERLSAEVA